ncbi:MAG: HD domain-containing protein [Candidatus Margulisbacteria bacterium]|nr:HD domain-containing protein [Candidatus Margulisiibacteriota bacterium]
MPIKKLLYRMKQFCVAMFSVYLKRDEEFARNYLNIQEMALFNRLPGFEKKHSVRVARKMLKLAHGKANLDERKLARIGLLHDIGKVVEHNSTVTKSFMVIVRFFLPKVYDRLADEGKYNLKLRRFYIHKHHGAVGAELLAKIGENSNILTILRKHDPYVEKPAEEDPIELKILQQADAY